MVCVPGHDFPGDAVGAGEGDVQGHLVGIFQLDELVLIQDEHQVPVEIPADLAGVAACVLPGLLAQQLFGLARGDVLHAVDGHHVLQAVHRADEVPGHRRGDGGQGPARRGGELALFHLQLADVGLVVLGGLLPYDDLPPVQGVLQGVLHLPQLGEVPVLQDLGEVFQGGVDLGADGRGVGGVEVRWLGEGLQVLNLPVDALHPVPGGGVLLGGVHVGDDPAGGHPGAVGQPVAEHAAVRAGDQGLVAHGEALGLQAVRHGAVGHHLCLHPQIGEGEDGVDAHVQQNEQGDDHRRGGSHFFRVHVVPPWASAGRSPCSLKMASALSRT